MNHQAKEIVNEWVRIIVDTYIDNARIVNGITSKEDGSKSEWVWYPTENQYQAYVWHLAKLG